jgi:hypothetical protein
MRTPCFYTPPVGAILNDTSSNHNGLHVGIFQVVPERTPTLRWCNPQHSIRVRSYLTSKLTVSFSYLLSFWSACVFTQSLSFYRDEALCLPYKLVSNENQQNVQCQPFKLVLLQSARLWGQTGPAVTGTTFIIGGRGRNREIVAMKVARLCSLVLLVASCLWHCFRLGSEEGRVMERGGFFFFWVWGSGKKLSIWAECMTFISWLTENTMCSD